jgi:effector-binding domain-containing protein
VPTQLSIGEFARVTHLSVRTLRRYHDAGLLEPARVDAATGYRYYSARQIPTAQVIHRLREPDMPLTDVHRKGRGHALVYLPVAGPPTPAGRVRPVTLPAVDLAVATHCGDHGTVDVTYGELGAWVVGHALAVTGPVRETYLVGPRDTADPARWRTEIGWPVFRVAQEG